MIVDGKRIKVTAERDPAKLPHKAMGVDIALECTGFFTDKEGGQKHLDAGAKRVLISAPAKGADLTVVYGVNHDKLTADHKIVTNASCTTNCLAPVAKVLNDAIGIERGLMTTIHAYTNDQKILDQIHPDMRRARAAGMSMIPTTTGAARAVGEVLPGTEGQARRLGDPRADPQRQPGRPDLHAGPRHDQGRGQQPAQGRGGLRPAQGHARLHRRAFGLDRPQRRPRPARPSTASRPRCIEGKLVRVVSWYDNEWGFSNRMVDTAGAMAKLG